MPRQHSWWVSQLLKLTSKQQWSAQCLREYYSTLCVSRIKRTRVAQIKSRLSCCFKSCTVRMKNACNWVRRHKARPASLDPHLEGGTSPAEELDLVLKSQPSDWPCELIDDQALTHYGVMSAIFYLTLQRFHWRYVRLQHDASVLVAVLTEACPCYSVARYWQVDIPKKVYS